MRDGVKHIEARELKRQLHDGGEIALLDAREEGVFARRHLWMASVVPLSRLELLIDDLVPRRTTRVVWCDDGDGSALRAVERMHGFGYQNVAVLEGGIAAWEAAGYRVYSGVHVPSKAFAEVVEHEAGTPYVSAPELKALIDSGADIAIFDSRSYKEYHNNSIPTAISVPGAELVYRFADLVPSVNTTVIVNCGGRTRSIIGAQALRNVVEGWHDGLASRRLWRHQRCSPAAARGLRCWAPSLDEGGGPSRRALRHSLDRQGHAVGLAVRSGAAHALRTRRQNAGRIRGRASRRCAVGARRAAGAGNRCSHRHLERTRGPD